jgi:hypothetical protein
MKDWERQTFRDEKRTNPTGFQASEEAARRQDLGIMSYWRASDWDKKNAANEKMGTIIKARSRMDVSYQIESALGNLVNAGFALAGHGTHGGGGVKPESSGGGDAGTGGGAS